MLRSPPASSESSTDLGAAFVVQIDRFQGPLDLLMHLIRRQEFDIFDIPISRITDQFLTAVRRIEATDLDSAGEFLEMAATLVRIKAQMLLPRPVDAEDEDPRAELVRRLLEYEQIREITARLERSETDRSRRHAKGWVDPRARAPDRDLPLETTLREFLEAACDITLPELVDTDHRVTPRTVSMEEKATLILKHLADEHRVEFRCLLTPFRDPMHGVMTFLAGLELSRRRRIHLQQARPFHELWLIHRDDAPADAEPGPASTESPTPAQESPPA